MRCLFYSNKLKSHNKITYFNSILYINNIHIFFKKRAEIIQSKTESNHKKYYKKDMHFHLLFVEYTAKSKL